MESDSVAVTQESEGAQESRPLEHQEAQSAPEPGQAQPVEVNADEAPTAQADGAAPEPPAAPVADTAEPSTGNLTPDRPAAVSDDSLQADGSSTEDAAREASATTDPGAPAQQPAVEEPPTADEAAAQPASEPVEMPLPLEPEPPQVAALSDEQLQPLLEAIVYVAEEPLTAAQMANALAQPLDRVQAALRRLIEEFDKPEHGIGIREVAGGFKIATKPEHHESVRAFVKSLKPPLKLSLPALETLAVIAYKQPVTGPEIMEVRGVQGLGVLKTLLDRKLIVAAGRKNVIGKPILYKTTKEFLIQFGLKDIGELPSLKEFEEIKRMAFGDSEPTPAPVANVKPAQEAPPTAPAEGAGPSGEAIPPPAPEPQADGAETAAEPAQAPEPEPEA